MGDLHITLQVLNYSTEHYFVILSNNFFLYHTTFFDEILPIIYRSKFITFVCLFVCLQWCYNLLYSSREHVCSCESDSRRSRLVD